MQPDQTSSPYENEQVYDPEDDQEHDQGPKREHQRELQGFEPLGPEEVLQLDESQARLSDYDAIGYVLQRGDIIGLKTLLDAGYDPEARNAEGYPIFHFFFNPEEGLWVDTDSQIALLGLLLEYGAKPNTSDAKGSNILCYCERPGDLALDKYLLSKGVDVNHTNHSFWTPLHFALSYQEPDRVKLYLEAGAKFNLFNVTPLHFLCFFGGRTNLANKSIKDESNVLQCAKLLIEHGETSRERDERGCTPLYHATKNCHFRVIDLLLRLDVFRGDYHMFPKGCELEESWYLETPCWRTPLSCAILAGKLDATNRLLEQGEYQPTQGSKSIELLRSACWRTPDAVNYVEMAQLLISRGYPIDMTCVAIAAYQVSQDMFRILLHKLDANVDDVIVMKYACAARLEDQTRKTPLVPLLWQREREAVMEMIMEANAPLNAKHMQQGPLYLAAGCCVLPIGKAKGKLLNADPELCRYLLARGSSPLQRDHNGRLPPLIEGDLNRAEVFDRLAELGLGFLQSSAVGYGEQTRQTERFDYVDDADDKDDFPLCI